MAGWTGFIAILLLTGICVSGQSISSEKPETRDNSKDILLANENNVGDTASYIITQGAEWRPFEYEKDILKGSAFDFSFFQDAPAGKYGFLQAKNGKFVFESKQDKPVRFYGVNLVVEANFLEKEWCEKLADRLAMSGYNAVRFHLFDGPHQTGVARNKPTDRLSTELDPLKMDQLDYLFYCMKERGIYVTIDLYSGRKLIKGEIPELPELELSGRDFKGLVFVLNSVMKNWEDFSRNFLTHINPYTGLAWKDDPALMTICLVNEDNISYEPFRNRSEISSIYEKKFGEWLRTKGISISQNDRDARFRQFLVETYNKSYFRMYGFLKGLGVKALITDQNFRYENMLTLMRDHYDFVDNHFYWDHPRYSVEGSSLPSTLHNTSAISRWAAVPGIILPSRIFGKPMCISEFNYAAPNCYRAESGPLVGAYAGLQDWDALFRFSYATYHDHIKEQATRHAWFAIAVDPINALSERIGLLFFLRGDVKSSGLAFPTLVSESCLDTRKSSDKYPKGLWALGLVGQSGSVVLDQKSRQNGKNNSLAGMPTDAVALNGLEKPLSATDWEKPYFFFSQQDEGRTALKEITETGIIPEGLIDLEKEIFKSSTGEIELHAMREMFKVITPKSEALIVPEGITLTGNVLQVENKQSRGVFFAGSVDGNNLAGSNRILILHLTDCHGNGIKFANEKMTELEDWGQAPYLIKAGKACVTLKGNFPSHKLYGISTSGKRIAEIPMEKNHGSISFDANIDSRSGVVMAYELVKE